MLLRVQDNTGRGPFKPGFTKAWCEYNHNLPDIIKEFPELQTKIKPYHSRDCHLGVGVRNGKEGLSKWFSESELKKLEKLGYKIVYIKDYEVVCESDNQVVFAHKLPLRYLPIFTKE